MSWWSRLLRRRDPLRDEALGLVVQVIRAAAEGAQTLAELRDRIARHAERGDLDKALVQLADSETIARDYIERG